MFRNVRVLTGCLSAFGWFLLTDIPYWCIIPLFFLGIFACKVKIHYTKKIWLNGIFAVFSALLSAYAVGVGVFARHGCWSLFFLIFAAALFLNQIPEKELARVSGWWCVLFILFFAALLVATVAGMRTFSFERFPYSRVRVLIFYLLAFLEPFSLGEEYRCAPLLLSLLLVPFGIVSWWALGGQAFSSLELPYFSVWAGVSVYSFRHFEGIILCLFYGMAVFRTEIFLKNIVKKNCNTKKSIV